MNTDTWYDTQMERVGKSDGAKDDSGEVKVSRGWHGTGGFPAQNIYEDRQVRIFILRSRMDRCAGNKPD